MEGRRFGRNDPCPCGSKRKYKQCCLGSGRYQTTAMPAPRGVYGEGVALLAPPARQAPPRRHPPRTMPAVTRVSVDYTFSEPFGQAEVNYCFEVGHLFPLVGGYVVPVEKVEPGMQFHLDNGAIATVMAVRPPKVWEPPPSEPNEDGNYLRRVIGRIKRTGFMVLDLFFGGQTITTTPGHLFYSLDRRGWVGAEALQVGEALLSDKGERLRLDGKGRVRHGQIELYNIEVEQLHTYFVGRTPGGAALVHNGTPVPGAGGCIPKPASTPVGSKRSPMENVHPNPPTTINGREYGGHAIDRMQGRGIPPSVVENTIQHGAVSPDPIPGRLRHFDPVNNITVVTEGGKVVTVIPGRR
jgi:hypothetical protein